MRIILLILVSCHTRVKMELIPVKNNLIKVKDVDTRKIDAKFGTISREPQLT